MICNNNYLADILRVCEIKDLIWVMRFQSPLVYLKAKCLKALNLLKVLSHTSWGADRTTFLKLYRSLVRSKLDYGCTTYGSARKSCLILYITKDLD